MNRAGARPIKTVEQTRRHMGANATVESGVGRSTAKAIPPRLRCADLRAALEGLSR